MSPQIKQSNFLTNVNPHYIIDANTKKEKGSHATAKAVAKKLSEAVIK